MQISLHLIPETPIRLDFSYYPKLAAAIYQAIAGADPGFADELHDGKAYRDRIKLFGFSPLYSRQTEIHPAEPQRNRLGGLIFKGACALTICSPWPELMNRLASGLAATPMLRIGSQMIPIKQASPLPTPVFKEQMVWRMRVPASCVTSWSHRNDNRKTYALPDAPVDGHTCEDLLKQNLIHKWRRLKEIRPEIAAAWLRQEKNAKSADEDLTEAKVHIRILPLSETKRMRRKKHQIKKAPVFSWIAPIEIQAPLPIQRIAWSCGLGEMNSMGFGVVEEVRHDF